MNAAVVNTLPERDTLRVAIITRLSTQNAGNEALSHELIKYAKRRARGEIRVLDRYPRYVEHLKISDLGSSPDEIVAGFGALVDRLAAKFTGRGGGLAPLADASLVKLQRNAQEAPLWIRRIKRKIGFRRNLAALGLLEREECLRAFNTLAWADFVMWNPAGEFHPTGDPDQTFRLLLLIAIAQKNGARTAVVNHSLEIADPRLEALVAHVYRNVHFVSVRESSSAKRAADLDVSADQLHMAPDLVFLASMSDVKPEKTSVAIPSGAIGFSLNGLEALNGRNEWEQLFASLKSLNRPFVFVSNAANHDLDLSRSLAREHGGLVIDHQPDYQELRAIFSCLDVLISSRLHSSILALCSGTPVVTIEPSVFKLTGIFEGLGYPFPTKNLGTPGWSAAVRDDVLKALERRSEYVQQGREIVVRQVSLIERTYGMMFAFYARPSDIMDPDVDDVRVTERGV